MVSYALVFRIDKKGHIHLTIFYCCLQYGIVARLSGSVANFVSKVRPLLSLCSHP